MICKPCQDAGDANGRGDYRSADRLHRLCHWRDCFCEHAIGANWVNR